MTIEINSEKVEEGRLELFDKTMSAIFLTEKAIRDIADAIKNQAKEEAPEGETGALKAHPVEITQQSLLGAGEKLEPFPSIGGGFTVRGAGGRFTRGGIVPSTAGQTFDKVLITLPDHPHYAKFVHNGTGIYGTFHTPIVPRKAKLLKFTYHGITYRRPWVYGQQANPYLQNAFLYVNRTYIPARIEKLRLEIGK
jgi:hypothetical protein